MTKFFMLVGLPASGKSTYAKQLQEKYNAVILSSDEIRKELLGDVNNQDNNTNIFDDMIKRTKQYLSNGVNVIYDATNINRKRRVHLINNYIKADEKVVYYMNTPFSKCIYNDNGRERVVGYDVIDKMYKTMQIPTILEGWNNVIFVNPEFKLENQYRQIIENNIDNFDYEGLFEEVGWIIREFSSVYEVPHDSKYHSFSISRHIYYVYDYVRKNYKGTRILEMLYASILHDLGKGYCKSFYNHKGEEKRYANYIGHENVSAQLTAEYLYKLGYSDELIKYVVDLVQFHMSLMDASEKQVNKIKGLLTDEQFEDLQFLREADLQAK